MSLYRAVELAANLIDSRMVTLHRAVDATMGNGYDTLFLARKVGSGGVVYAFDLQEDALRQTGHKLEEEGLEGRVILINEGHENMDLHVKGPVDAVMFNLGYLPGGDTGVVTRPATTLEAVKKSLTLIREGGMVTIVAYTGHPGGMEEKDLLRKYLPALDKKKFTVLHCIYANQHNFPPELFVIEKMVSKK